MRGPDVPGCCALVAAALCWLGVPSPAVAEDHGAKQFLHDLVSGAAYSLESYATYFPQVYPSSPARAVDDKQGIVWAKGTVKSQAGIGEATTFKLAMSVAGSNESNDFRGAFMSPDSEKPYARHLDVKECSLRYDRKRFAMIAGKAPLPVGLSTIYSPADRYQIVSAANPIRSESLGAWQVALDLFFGDNTLKMAALPIETRSPVAHGRSRWLGESGEDLIQPAAVPLGGGGLVAGSSGLTTSSGETARSVFRNRPGLLVKWSGVVPGIDYFAAAHYGPSLFPVLQNLTGRELIAEAPMATTFSGGASSTVEAWEFHGEGVYQRARHDQDQDFLRYVVGTTYRETRFAEKIGFDEISPTVEYAGELVLDEQDAPGFLSNSAGARPNRNAVLLKVDVMPSDKLTWTVAGAKNLTTEDSVRALVVEYRPNDHLTLKASLVEFDGNNALSPFGRWDRNDYVEVGVIRRF